MLVSRWVLQAYPQLRGKANPNYYLSVNTRPDQSTYGQYSAIYEGSDIISDIAELDDESYWDLPVWRVDQYNGENWATVELDSNFSLTLTNNGIKALTDAQNGQYKLDISRIVIKQTLIPVGTNVIQLTDGSFTDDYINVCLDTDNKANSTFTLEKCLTHRINSLDGGLQFNIELPLDCLGQEQAQKADAAPKLTDFYVGSIGLYVKNQNSEIQESVLFAVAALPAAIQKVATTPTQIGNALKFYLNTTLSNMGNVTNVNAIIDSVNSIPEVVDDGDLVNTFDGINAPYNLYLVDNHNGTNVPALAVRKSDSLYDIEWTYFTPTDDSIIIPASLKDASLKDYMAAAWDGQKYVPADPTNTNLQLTGLYNNYHIIYAGTVNNLDRDYYYNLTFDPNSPIQGMYKPGDSLYIDSDPDHPANNIRFVITVVSTDPNTGMPTALHYTPKTGQIETTINNVIPQYIVGSGDGDGLLVSVTSERDQTPYVWNFPTSYINKPIYVDAAHPGKLTITESNAFIGWCTGPNSIRLALDLRNEATNSVYGTTRYAREDEIKNADGNAGMITSVSPDNLYKYYLKKEPSSIGTVAGDSAANPQIVNTYTRFAHAIISSMSADENNGVAFQGTSYRALWADLAEYYRSDRVYPAGTLICIGCGINEITEAQTECNGIISTKPGYQLGEKENELDLPVALVGKVPVLFAEDCIPHFGDRIYLSKTTPGRASIIPNGKCLGKIIDKDKNLDQKHLIMCSVRIEF